MGKRHCDHTWGKEDIYAADGSWVTRCCVCGQQLAAGGADSHPNPPDAAADAAMDSAWDLS